MRGVLIDLDGVIWESDQVVAGAPEAIEWLIAKRIPHLFVTNTTSRPPRVIADKLARLGVPAQSGDILTPPLAAVRWLTDHDALPVALLVPDGTREDFGELPVVQLGEASEPAAIVVGDIGPAWDFATLNTAFRLLMRDPAPQLVALGMTRYWRDEDGLRLDVAPFVKALEHAAGCTAAVLGKPAADFFAIALQSIGCEASETVMVGDDISGDVAGARRAGLTGLLVRTGKFRPADLDGDIRPDGVLESIAELPDWWAENALAD